MYALGATHAHADATDEAQALLAKRKWAEAAIVLRSALRRDPHSVSANAELAKALLYLGRREEALGILDHAIELNRGPRRDWLVEQSKVIAKIFMTNASFQLYQDGVDLLSVEKFRQAREKFEQVLAAEPSNVEVLTRIGQAYLLDGDSDSAAERLKLARRLDPYEPEIQLWLGRAMQLRGEMSGALAELHAATAQLKQSELAPLWLSEALEAAGESASALLVLEEDVKGNPLHVSTLYRLATLKIQSAQNGTQKDQKVLWSARKDFQYALSRLSDYTQPGRRRFEGELGVELPHAEKELHEKIQSSLQKLESRLEAQSNG